MNLDLDQIDELSRELDAKIVMNLDLSLKRKFKEQFTQFFSSVLYDELELLLVIDANIVISAAMAMSRGKKCMDILDSPILKFLDLHY